MSIVSRRSYCTSEQVEPTHLILTVSRGIIMRTLFCSLLLATAVTLPARAVVLQQNWTAGQTSAYNCEVIGKMNVKLPADLGIPGAGMSFDNLQLTSSFDLTNLVLKVNESGVGDIATSITNLKMRSQSAQGAIVIENGKSGLFLGNRLLGQPQNVDLSMLEKPSRAAQISKRGQLRGMVAIDGTRQISENDLGKFSAFLPDMTQLSTFLGSLQIPELWPEGDVKVGDKWSAEVNMPVGENQRQVKVGQFDFELQEPQTQDGQELQHIHVVGSVALDAAQRQAIEQQIGDKRTSKPIASTRKCEGDLWFDAAAGHIAGATLNMKVYDAREGSFSKNGRTLDNSSWTIFDGTLAMRQVAR